MLWTTTVGLPVTTLAELLEPMMLTMEGQPRAAPVPEAALVPVVELRQVSKLLQVSIRETRQVFTDLSLTINRGDRLALYAVDSADSSSLLQCISGVEPPDRGRVDHFGSVSWPLGSNQAFSGRLSGYSNARFAAELYSQPGCLDEDLQLIQELAQIPDALFHEPLSSWTGSMREALKLAVSLAFEFDVLSVGRISNWDFRSAHPHSVRIRDLFENRINGRTVVMSAAGQNKMALEYCDQGVVLIGGSLVYHGDPEICLELVKEESQRLKVERRARVKARLQEALRQDQYDEPEDETDVAFA